jgi:sodium/pantothenate symporter
MIVMLAMFVIVGLIQGRKIENTTDYYIAGRKAPTVLVVGSLIASYLSSTAYMGDTGFMFDGFLMPYVLLCAVCSVGYIFGTRYFGIHLRRSRVLTLPEFFGRRFNSPRIRMVLSIITVVGIMCYLTTVTKGGALLMQNLLGMKENPNGYLICLLIVWVVYTSFTFFSGSKGVIVTDTIMFFIFAFMAFISVPFIFQAAGHFSGAINPVTDTVVYLNDAEHVQQGLDMGIWSTFTEPIHKPDWGDFDFTNITMHLKPGALSAGGVTNPDSPWAYMGSAADSIIWGVVLGFIWLIAMAVSPWQTSRYMMAKNEHVVMRTGLIGAIVAFAVLLFIDLAMTVANLIDIPPTASSEETFIWMAMNILPRWLGIVIFCGIMSAVLSSCSTFASLIGFSLANDILPAINKKMKPENGLRNSRIVMLIASLVVVVITYWTIPGIQLVSYFAASLFAISWGFVAFMSTQSKRISENGAFWSILVGAIVFTVLSILKNVALIPDAEGVLQKVAFPTLLRPEILGLASAIAAYFIANRPAAITDEERAYFKMLHTPEPEEVAQRLGKPEIKKTLWGAKAVILFGVAFIAILIVIYLIPYQAGIDILNGAA